jgi:oligoendopeptidase F
VNKNIFYARARNYDSVLESILGEAEIPVSIYHGLIDAVNSRLDLVQDFTLLRNVLRDNSAGIYGDRSISYDDAQELVKNALAVLGDEYAAIVKAAFNENWIDVFPASNKADRIYCHWLHDPHPFIMMHYTGDLHDVSTIAHELGHAVHFMLSYASQPFLQANAEIFTTEVVSMVNEILFLRHMIANAETNEDKIVFIDGLLDIYTFMFFSMAKIAEFELRIYEEAEAGGVLNADTLNSIWLELTNRYNGKIFTDEMTPTQWAFQPTLFEISFYFYTYAVGMVAASQLASGIFDDQPGALERYLELLRSGSRCDPITLLMNAGVDMTSPRVYDNFFEEYSSFLEQLRTLMMEEGLL